MKVSWDNAEKTRIRVDNGDTITVVPASGDHPLWLEVAGKVRKRKLTIGKHTIAKHDPHPPAPSYQEARAANYPALSDLADALYWKEQGDPAKFDAWLAACAAVKDAIPKQKPKEQA